MEVHTSVAGFRKALETARLNGQRVGFVPTMGALHAGHLSLLAAARQNTDVVSMSIFVNPLQFGPKEDLAQYPRPTQQDLELARQAGVAHVFMPEVEEMYPVGRPRTTVNVSGVGEVLEGAHRPGHFDGVATVVAKLFSITGECNAYFGEKDYQQLQVVKRMVDDLTMPVNVVGCPIVREEDGLALSSRNVYLSQSERKAALSLSAGLNAGVNAFRSGETSAKVVVAEVASYLEAQPGVVVDYIEAVDVDLSGISQLEPGCRLLVAATVGTTRLIDNIELTS
jgi:pantoate--beta-alanine ligase